jgi:hypothetical protein
MELNRLDKKEKVKKVSYRHKETIKCPVCSLDFNREEMLTGGGRLIAGKLTDELRRLFEKNDKYGKVYPLAYLVTVCPRCLYAAYPKDFNTLLPDEIEKIREAAQARANTIKKFFGELNFNDDRNLQLGAASYLLAVDCYAIRNRKVAPTCKKAVSSIRAAWLFDDLAIEIPEKPYKKLSIFFYTKAYGFYHKIIDLLMTGQETLEDAGHIGPDFEKNWGYDGILYMCAILTVKVGIKEPDINKRVKNFETTKRFLSRLFGDGKQSKSRPGDLMDKIRDLYDKINLMVEEWNKEIGDSEKQDSTPDSV